MNHNSQKLPHFVCIGVAKAGTTTLHHALLHHPQIFLPERKETFFFSSDSEYRKGINWYATKYFSLAQNNMLRGEIAATYLYHSEKVSQRLAECYGETLPKIIVLFRDPVHRAYSQYWHMRRLGLENLSFREALALENQRRKSHYKKNSKNGKDRFAYFENGLYAKKLEPFFDKFEKERFLFLLFDDLVGSYDSVMNQVLDFLGVTVLDLPCEHRNEAKIAENSQTMLWNRYPKNQKAMVRKVIPGKLRRMTGNLLGLNQTRPFKYPPMAKDLDVKLREKFEPEIIRLSKIINKDLSHWLP